MIYDVLDPLLKQLATLHQLSNNRADATWSHDAIRACTKEIEDLTAGNACAYYAREIEVALEHLSRGESTRTRICETIVGGRIELLEEYVDRVRRTSEEMLFEMA